MEETQWPLSGGWPEPVAPDVHIGVKYTRHVQAKCRRRGVEDTSEVSIKQTLKIRVLFFNYSNIKSKRSFSLHYPLEMGNANIFINCAT